jgi:indolepyruvate ferredoxin oxidoreductase, beta subunit
MAEDRDRITIAILALGGQGGGVLADWILDIADRNGFVAQGTSVPGVAQRTGSTVYYIEMVRRSEPGANRPDPVLAMMPVPGDVDIVIASELMEAGRAILRGFVSEDRTTLIGSTHRIYAISEKSAPGDGTASSQRILDAAGRRAARFIGFDMDAAASASGSVISSVMLGALAGSEALPFTREAFEEAIRAGGKAVASNLKGFALGVERVSVALPEAAAVAAAEPTTEAGRVLKARIVAELPEAAQAIAVAGVRKLMDYQDRAYAELYLDRLARLPGEGALLAEAARYLALWMAYDDVVRVADLKVRATRSARVKQEVRLAPGQVMVVTEYMHPRLRELCDALPARLGAFILARPGLRRALEPLFSHGRHVETTSLRWFLILRCVAGLRRFRRSSLRFGEEQARIEAWLADVARAAAVDMPLAIELAEAPRLLKGYGDTFDRGWDRFQHLIGAARTLAGAPDAAARIRELREVALADESGAAFSRALDVAAA